MDVKGRQGMKRFRCERLTGLAIAACAMLGALPPANAQTFSSSYTSTAPKDCRVKQLDGGSMRVCPGPANLVVLINEGDLRETVSVGRNRAAAASEPASNAWFKPFATTAHTVEWRAADGKPFAIIQRWSIFETDKEGRSTANPMLAVTRLPPGAVCHVAYIDVQAKANPNELARKAADELARSFKCGKDEVQVIGETGRAVSMAKR
jgi:hypothetical protein